jgi:hypothetical protein
LSWHPVPYARFDFFAGQSELVICRLTTLLLLRLHGWIWFEFVSVYRPNSSGGEIVVTKNEKKCSYNWAARSRRSIRHDAANFRSRALEHFSKISRWQLSPPRDFGTVATHQFQASLAPPQRSLWDRATGPSVREMGTPELPPAGAPSSSPAEGILEIF